MRELEQSVWLEISYEGEAIITDLREQLDQQVEGSALEILRIRNARISQQVLVQGASEETLDDLDELEVFERCLDAHQVEEEQREELLASYRQVLSSLHDEDGMAESTGGQP